LRRAIAILILIATWTISPSLGETATIVAVWTRDEIALAADSGAEQLVVDQSPATICKVQKTGKVAYTMAGLYRDPVDSLDTFALARQVFSGPGLLSDQLNSFQHRVEDPLTKALARLKKEDSKTYDDFFARKSALSFFAASVVQRVPRLVGIDIGLRWLVLAAARLRDRNATAFLACAGAERLPLADQSVDVWASESLLENTASAPQATALTMSPLVPMPPSAMTCTYRPPDSSR